MFDTLTARGRLLTEAQHHERAALEAGRLGDPLDLMRHHREIAQELRDAALDVDRVPAWAADDLADRTIKATQLRMRELTAPAEDEAEVAW